MRGANSAGLSCLERLLGTIATASVRGGQRSFWAILNGAARSSVIPNILLQRRAHFEQGRMQPMPEAPAAIGDNGGFWYALGMCPRRLRRGVSCGA